MSDVENKQFNLSAHLHIRLDRREPFINLLYQNIKLINDLKAADAKRKEIEAINKSRASRSNNQNVRGRRGR